jgi:hypothetical protein
MDNFEERNIILLLEDEIDDILDGVHNEFTQVESNHTSGDNYRLVFSTKDGKYYETCYSEDIMKGIFYAQSFATQVFPVERKATIVVYE